MTIDEIKKFQAHLGISIEVAQNMKLLNIKNVFTQAMEMSSDYERLVRQTQYFFEKVDPSHLEVSEVW